jgi:hypothetical protein
MKIHGNRTKFGDAEIDFEVLKLPERRRDDSEFRDQDFESLLAVFVTIFRRDIHWK